MNGKVPIGIIKTQPVAFMRKRRESRYRRVPKRPKERSARSEKKNPWQLKVTNTKKLQLQIPLVKVQDPVEV